MWCILLHQLRKVLAGFMFVVCMLLVYFFQPSAVNANPNSPYYDDYENHMWYYVDLYGDGNWTGFIKDRMLPAGSKLKVAWFSIKTKTPEYFVREDDGSGVVGLFHPDRGDKNGNGTVDDLILNAGLVHTHTEYELETRPYIRTYGYYTYYFHFEVPESLYIPNINERITRFYEKLNDTQYNSFMMNGKYGIHYARLGDKNLGVDSYIPVVSVDAPAAGSEIEPGTTAFVLSASDQGDPEKPMPDVYYEWVTEEFYDSHVNGNPDFDWTLVNETDADAVRDGQPIPAGPEYFPYNNKYYLLIRAEDIAVNRVTQVYGPYTVVVETDIEISVTPYLDGMPVHGNRIKFDDNLNQPVFVIDVVNHGGTVIESVYYNWNGMGEGIGWVDIGEATVRKSITDIPLFMGEQVLNVTVTPSTGDPKTASFTYVHDGTAPKITLMESTTSNPYNSHTVLFWAETDPDDTLKIFDSWSHESIAENVTDWVENSLKYMFDYYYSVLNEEKEDGTYYFHVKTVDAVGNIGYYTMMDGDQVRQYDLDTTPPELLIDGKAPACIALRPKDVYCEVDVDENPVRKQIQQLTTNEPMESIRYKIVKEPVIDDTDYDKWREGWITVSLEEDSLELVADSETLSDGTYYFFISARDKSDNYVYFMSDGFVLEKQAGGTLHVEYVLDPDYEHQDWLGSSELLTSGPIKLKLYYEEEGFPIEGTRTVRMYHSVDMEPVEIEVASWERLPGDENKYMAFVEYDASTDPNLASGLGNLHILYISIVQDRNGYEVFPVDYYYPPFFYDNQGPEIVDVSYDPLCCKEVLGPVTATITYTDDFLLDGSLNPVTGSTQVQIFENTPEGGNKVLVSDIVGNTTEVTLEVDWIMETLKPELITYTPDHVTKEDVTATFTFPIAVNFTDPAVTLVNAATHTYQYSISDNGIYTIPFTYEDSKAGQVILEVDWIDRNPPKASFIYTFNAHDGSITATLSLTDDHGGKMVRTDESGNAWLEDDWTHTFTENGEYPFYFKDEAGNFGSATAVVTAIDRTPPEVEIHYSTTVMTNGTVRATVISNEPIVVLNNEGKDYYDFEHNSTFTFEVRDRFFNTTTVTAEVNNIDHTPPNVDIEYSNTDVMTKDDVIATLYAIDGEDFIVLNNSGRNIYRFTDNGSFTFIVADQSGNIIEKTATVTHINKEKVQYDLVYSTTEITNGNVTVTVVPKDGASLTFLNNGGSPSVTFSQNGIIWLLAKDALDNSYIIDVTVTNIDKQAPDISFTGDLLIELNSVLPNLKADVSVTDNVSVDLKDGMTVNHNINVASPGIYQATYTVKDEAGNETSRTRTVRVIDISTLSVFVNSQLIEDRSTIQANKLKFDTYGTRGESEFHIAFGEHPISAFKTGRYQLIDNTYDIDRQGYYTIYIRDQELQQMRILLYVIPQYGKGN